jgi:phospholipase C
MLYLENRSFDNIFGEFPGANGIANAGDAAIQNARNGQPLTTLCSTTSFMEPSWLILQKMDGQVANTLRPFGATLPQHRDFPTCPEALNQVRERGWTMLGRMASRVWMKRRMP